jgi:hypothetical protein
MYRFFYLPYLYTNRAKLTKRGRLLSYFLMLVLPSGYFALLQTDFTFSHLLAVLLGLVITQNLYEIGYIQNDTETIKKEKKPTLRLNDGELSFYEQHKRSVYLLRSVIDLVLCLGLFAVLGSGRNFWTFVGVVHLIIPVFLVYNSFRNKWNLLLHLVLAILKYTSVQFLFLGTMKPEVFIVSVVAYPVINFVERVANPQFTDVFSKYLRPRLARFRVAYYLLALLVSLGLYHASLLDVCLVCAVAYYLVYRLLILMAGIE